MSSRSSPARRASASTSSGSVLGQRDVGFDRLERADERQALVGDPARSAPAGCGCAHRRRMLAAHLEAKHLQGREEHAGVIAHPLDVGTAGRRPSSRSGDQIGAGGAVEIARQRSRRGSC